MGIQSMTTPCISKRRFKHILYHVLRVMFRENVYTFEEKFFARCQTTQKEKSVMAVAPKKTYNRTCSQCLILDQKVYNQILQYQRHFTMHFFNFSTISSSLLLVTHMASAIPLDRRATANDVSQDVRNIDAGVRALTAHTAAYKGGSVPSTLVQGTPILVDAATIHIANRKGFVDALAAPKFSTPDSQKILATVGTTVTISIPAGIEVLKSKKAAFQQSGLVPIILASLNLLLNDHDTFSAAVLQKLTLDPVGTAAAKAGIALIHNSIASGIQYYST